MTSRKIGNLFFILIFLLGGISRRAEADDVSVQLTMEQNALSLDDQATVSVTVAGLRSADQPSLANTEGFDVQGTGSSSQVQIVNGSYSSQTVYTYLLTPKKTGTFSIGPAKVTAGGKTYESNRLTFSVGKGQPGAASATNGNSPFKIEADVDNKAPYRNQQIVYTFRFLSRGRLANAQLALPDFNNFLKEPLEKQKDSQAVVNGIAWSVTEIRYALFPLTAGSLTIPAAVLTGEALVQGHRPLNPFDNFFDNSFFFGGQTRRIRLHSEPIALQVRSLPSQGKPAGFSGLVGQFRLTASLGKTQLAVGDSTTLSLRLGGEGNVRDGKLPELNLSGFKTYEDQPATETRITDGKLAGSKTFKIALVPLQPGHLVFPAIQVPFFNPASGRYELATSSPLALEVTPGSGKENLDHVAAGDAGSDKNEIKVQGEDLMPIKGELSVGTPLSSQDKSLLFLFDVGCPLMALAAYLFRKRRDRYLLDTGRSRREKAYRAFRSRLKASPPGKETYEQASGALRDYLGDKLDFDGRALTPYDVQRKLAPHGVPDPTIRVVQEFLKNCEKGQYGGEAITPERAASNRAALEALVKQLEKEISA